MVGIDVAETSNAPEKARAFRQRHHLTYLILVDGEGEAQRAFRVEVLPTNVILDGQGTVRYAQPGFDPAAIERVLVSLTGR